MPKAESAYPRDWLTIALKDLNRAEKLFELDDLEGAAFNIQQAAEKYLKAFLLFNGWKLRRIHDLTVLLIEAIQFDPALEQYLAEIRTITEYYMVDRYPLMLETGYRKDEIMASLHAVQQIATAIRHVIEE